MKKKSAPIRSTSATPKMVMSVKVVAISLKFAAIVAAILAFGYFITIAYSAILSPDKFSGTALQLLMKVMPIFATGFGAFVLERISKSIEKYEQEGLFASMILIAFTLLSAVYSTMFANTISYLAILLYILIAVGMIVLLMNQNKFKKDGSNSLVFFALISAVLTFLASFSL